MIINRTQQDVDDAKVIRAEKVQTFTELTQSEEETLEKGMLTINTLNRIENKQAEVKALINSVGYYEGKIVSKVWNNNDWLYREDWERILKNESELRRAFFVYSSTKQVPNINLGYEELNSIESILVDLADMYDELIGQYKVCGTFRCGE